jgi:hypothetical protein
MQYTLLLWPHANARYQAETRRLALAALQLMLARVAPEAAAAIDGAQLCVFDLRRGQQEGQELDKILFFHPADCPILLQLSVIGLCEGIITFTRSARVSFPLREFLARTEPAHLVALPLTTTSTVRILYYYSLGNIDGFV